MNPLAWLKEQTGRVFYGWWIVLASSIICMLGYGIGLYSFGVFFKPMMDELGWSRAMTAGAASLRRIEGGITSPLVGWAVDKYGPRPVIALGVLLFGLGSILMYFVNSLVLLYLVYGVLMAFGMNLMLYLPNQAAISNWFVRRTSRALALLTVGAGIGGFICAPAAAFLIGRVGWRWSFVVMGVVIIVVALPLSLLIRHRPEDMGLTPDGGPAQAPGKGSEGEAHSRVSVAPGGRDWTLREAFSSRVFWILACSFFLVGMTHPVVTVHAVAAMTDAGIPDEQAAFAFGLMILFSIIGRLFFGYMGDFLEKRFLFMATYILQGAGIFVLMHARTMGPVYLFIVLYGLGFGGGVPLGPALRAEYFGRKSFAKIGGFMSPVIMVGGVAGPILAGYFFDSTGSYQIIFALIVLLQILASVSIFFARPERPRLAGKIFAERER